MGRIEALLIQVSHPTAGHQCNLIFAPSLECILHVTEPRNGMDG